MRLVVLVALVVLMALFVLVVRGAAREADARCVPCRCVDVS
ncbi:hypothetical protein SAMN05421806_10211 [Streptomyces indicus]|uniref:Uncharacterized protein n=1 Tax=Streptomyces indicus TaxID=417292 RepID=A0A1G8VSD2_9ACTN|nr:hypothetical protein SAMN05421806_10211 [Streptomyces indicus]